MKVSVVLPIYNGEKTLKATLDSLLNQTYKDFQLVACIDGTKDGSKAILEDYRTKFKALLILENKHNRGLGPTMNRLVSNSIGDYIAVAEQDDYYYKDRLGLQVKLLDEKEHIGLVSGVSEFWDGEKITMNFPGLLVNGGQYPKGEDMFLLNYRNQIKVVNSCMMFRKDVHINNGLYFTSHYPSISVDWTYVLRFSLVSEIHGLSNILVRLDRRQERNSVTSNKSKQFSASRELIRSFAYEHPYLIKKYDYKFAMTTQHLMELSHFGKLKFMIYYFVFFMQNPTDVRWNKYITKRFKQFIKN